MIMEKKKLLKKEIILDGFKQNYVVESMINNVDGFINLLTLLTIVFAHDSFFLCNSIIFQLH